MTHAKHALNEQIGKRIRALRRAIGLTAVTLAQRLDWPMATLINYEYGRRPLTVERLAAIADALDVSLLALLVPDAVDMDLIDQLIGEPALAREVRFYLDTLQAEVALQDEWTPSPTKS